MVLAGPTDIFAFLMGFFWLELHLLTFEIKNQIIGLEEDRLSKPNRPIVAGRLSVAAAQNLYLAVGALSFAWTPCNMVTIYCYNEGGISRHWFLKSFLGSIGYVCYCWGTTVIFDHGKPLSNVSLTAIAMSGLLHTATIVYGHAQDFRDRPGDATIERKTLPQILPPRLARWSLAFPITVWTAALLRLWALPHAVAIIFILLCLTSGTKFVRDHSVESDCNSSWYYNVRIQSIFSFYQSHSMSQVWLITAHLLPLFARIAAWRVVNPTSFLL
ncbi:UbiA prenyltransferase family-domain-containing protein [Mycena vitilis]|nr:UbiA prenyltransferase family-domain-containing protein [Mycena vitilis]